jgi:ABC-type multidrug transport system ATPase subunit
VEEEQCYRFLSFTAPYQLLPEQFTAMEVVTLWGKTKAFRDRIPSKELLERAGLGQANHKLIAKFSSGMKTRLKLALALYCDVPLIVLDEPTSNLDAQGVDWYLQSIEQVPTSTTVLVASNVPAEYAFCSQTVVMHG